MNDAQILSREASLRAWFTRDADPVRTEIDGLDIGWGGVQRWVTARMPAPSSGPHLDFACGYGTFLAELGWRFPEARLVGLNIDYDGPHALIGALLARAGVQAELVRADALHLPFEDRTFRSASCFMGLQDIQIGFGQAGVWKTLGEAARVLQRGGMLTLLDEFTFEQLGSFLERLPLEVVDRLQRPLDVRWDRPVAERAVKLYAEGWAIQARTTDPASRERVYDEVHHRMTVEMERQLEEQGYFVPFGPVRMIVLRNCAPGERRGWPR